MHPVLMLTRNNLELTKRAVESAYQQRIKTALWIVDNGSTDGTVEWLEASGINHKAIGYNAGVSYGWNRMLRNVFENKYHQFPHALVINNDVVLPEHFYAALLSYDEPFVTGVAIDNMEGIRNISRRMPLTPNPDFSAFLIRAEAWHRIGPFNERMMHYASDADYHVRGHRLGVGMWKANVPYYHERSSTMNNASPQDRAVIQAQAEADRGQFRALYGCVPGEKGYDDLFK